MKPVNMRQTAITWISKFSRNTLSPGVGNFPQKQTVTSEKLHSNQVSEHGRG